MRRSNLVIGLYMLAVFATGVAVGGFGHRLYTVGVVTADRGGPPKPSPEEFRRQYVGEMQSRLHLDAGQISQLNAILDATRDRFREVRDRFRPEMKQIQDEQVSKIRGILNQDQQAEYEKLRVEREKRREEKDKKEGR
jgi:hypothetical protein